MKTCCFTGHRNIPTAYRETIQKKLYEEINKLADDGYDEFISGGARGFDLLAAMSVMAVKKKHSKIKLHLIIPCADQARKWNDSDKALYEYILNHADSKETLHNSYITGCMHERNRKMVDSSQLCVAYLTRDFGGTKSTVEYAIKKNIKVVYIK